MNYNYVNRDNHKSRRLTFGVQHVRRIDIMQQFDLYLTSGSKKHFQDFRDVGVGDVSLPKILSKKSELFVEEWNSWIFNANNHQMDHH